MNFIVYDLFCGAGGTTSGTEEAEVEGVKVASVIAAVNHDPLAIESHSANHAGITHFTEDIRTLDVSRLPIVKHRENKRVVLWASLECTNFSNAKGGLPRDADSRTLANHLFRYIEKVDPDYIMIENVREFMAWGPLDKAGKPLSRLKGKYYLRWCERVKSMGYAYDRRLLNSADFGAHTSRIRYFGIFARHGLPIAFPVATHSKKNHGDLGLQPWKPVRDVLDLEVEGDSIFTRKKDLVENTLKRILSGLEKHVIDENEAWIVKYISNDAKTGANPGASIDVPSPTVTTQNRLYLAQLNFMHNYNGNLKTSTSSVELPARTLTTKDRLGKVACDRWIDKRYNGSHNHQSVNEPAGTLTTNPKLALMKAQWLDKQYRGEENHQSIDVPAGTITTTPKLCMMSAKPFIMPTNFTNGAASIDDPLGTITANRKWHYLINPQYKNGGASIQKPCFTLIARMDKRPPYIVSGQHIHARFKLLHSTYREGKKHICITSAGTVVIRLFDTDSVTMTKIKLFMATFGIVDIKMRMLNIDELKRITGLPAEYVLKGTKADQKKFIGNAVTPIVPKRWFEALYRANICEPQSSDYDTLPLVMAQTG